MRLFTAAFLIAAAFTGTAHAKGMGTTPAKMPASGQNWVSWKLSPGGSGASSAKVSFSRAPDKQTLASTLKDYAQSGYEAGHMVPSGERARSPYTSSKIISGSGGEKYAVLKGFGVPTRVVLAVKAPFKWHGASFTSRQELASYKKLMGAR